jgi:phosphoglycolate phosphatase
MTGLRNKQIRTIVFDLDGTLVDSNHIKQSGFDIVLQDNPKALELLHDVLKINPYLDRSSVFLEIGRQLFDDNVIERKRWVSSMVSAYTIYCEDRVSQAAEITGADYVLDALVDRGIISFISSATPEQTLRNIVRKRHWVSKVQGIYGAPTSKEEHLNRIQREVRCKKEEILYVGDSRSDRDAAHRFGCLFAGVGTVWRNLVRLPDFWIENLLDPRLLRVGSLGK